MKKKIVLNDFVTIKRFASEVVSFKSNITLTSFDGEFRVDAKSLMALYVLDLEKVLSVEIFSDDEQEIKDFNEAMKQFEA